MFSTNKTSNLLEFIQKWGKNTIRNNYIYILEVSLLRIPFKINITEVHFFRLLLHF